MHVCGIAFEVFLVLKGVQTCHMCARSEDSLVLQAEADSIELGSCAEVEQVEASLYVGTSARQLIMEGVIQLQVSACIILTCSVFCASCDNALSVEEIAVVKVSEMKHKHTLEVLCSVPNIQNLYCTGV